MIRKLLLGIVAALVIFAAIGAWIWRPIAATHSALLESDLPPILPLGEFYANQEWKWGYTVSRDGSKLAWIEIKWFDRVLMVKDLASGTVSQIEMPKFNSWRYYWAPDGNSLLLNVDRNGSENFEIAILDLGKKDNAWRYFDLGSNTRNTVHQIPRKKSDEILIKSNQNNPAISDLYRLNLKTGKTEPVGVEPERQVTYIFDYESRLFGRTIFGKTGSGDWIFETGNTETGFSEIARGNYSDNLNIFGTVTEDQKIYAVSNRGRNTNAFVKLDLTDGSEEVIFEDDRVDVGWVYINPATNELQMIKSYPGAVEHKFYDANFEALTKLLGATDNAEINLRSASIDYSKLVFRINEPLFGHKTYLVDANQKTAELLTTTPIERYKDSLSIAEPVFFNARDGQEVPAFLSRPKGVEGPAPLVIIVHGGPISRTYGGFRSLYAVLNNRGYAVLDVNYRGSWGYGRRFAEAGKDEIAGKMSSDIIDARQWAVEKGIADPDAVGIYGISWGGFEVMTALTQNSDLFAAGVNINGVADLSTMLEEVPDYWRGWQEWLLEYAADPATEEGLKYLQDRSPLYHADKMSTPLLIYQGGADVRVVQGQSDRMVAELRKHDAPVEYVLVPGVGHNPRGWPWQRSYLMYRHIERFYAKHLGGRAGGFDSAILGAHILPE